jgi:glycine/D-amino acid oxidase-like deaminating enzyme
MNGVLLGFVLLRNPSSGGILGGFYLCSMQVDYLIVGQGICGTMLSWFFHREEKAFLVIDDNNENSSSKIAAGIINPVTGRRYAYTWMIDEVMPFAVQCYEEMERHLDKKLVHQKSIIDFFPSPQMRNAFIDRLTENDTYLHSYPDQNHFNQFFNYDFGCGEISPAFIVHVEALLSTWRKKLQELNTLKEEKFDVNKLKVEKDFISYQNITAQKIIFCDGSDGVNNKWFQLLPYAPNKGEALIIECNELTDEHVFKKGLMLAPLPQENLYWIGSNYQWEFENDQPSQQFYQHATTVLNGWLKKPYKVLAHKAAVRPATLERRPFVGFHPQLQNVGILNGMGTKGTSLAPFFAHQLTQNLVYNFPIAPEADIHRFARILSKI